jgi:tripartite-type tricarboxylate transporter receptor subunit TctC
MSSATQSAGTADLPQKVDPPGQRSAFRVGPTADASRCTKTWCWPLPAAREADVAFCPSHLWDVPISRTGSILLSAGVHHLSIFTRYEAPILGGMHMTNLKLPYRRQFLHLAAGTAALPALSRIAGAQAYPSRPVRWIVGFAAGGPNDILARLMGQWLSERLGQPFVIENRPGAGGNIGTEAVVRAAPDGYTLLMVATSAAINATLYEQLNFNFIHDIAPVASIIGVPLVMEVHPSIPAKTVPELIAYAKANPGRINLASPGNGTAPHLAGELFKMMTGANMLHVPYRGSGPALTDLLGGQVQVMFDALPSSIEDIRAGKLRALAVTSVTHSESLPDIPPMINFLPGYETTAWFGVGAPKATPTHIIDRLNKEINAGLADAKIKARITDLGGTPFALLSAEFGKLIADETEKWGKVIRAANIKPE